MSFLGERRTRRTLIWLIMVVAVLGIAVAACAIYLNDYYRADAEAIAAFAPVDGIAVQALEDNTLVYAPEEARTGFIFYPGGKVEYTAYGSEDKVLNREKYDANEANLPADFVEVVIDGGCHAYFGVYGAQHGDGVPAITNKEQIKLTASAITEFINK